MAMGRGGWDGPGPPRPAGYERGVTAEAVSKLCDQGHLNEAVEALGVLVETDCNVSTSLFYAVLKKCADKNLALGRRVHAFTVKQGYQSDTFLCNHILRMYASHGLLQDAMDVFTVVPNPDAFMWSSIISAHVKHGRDKQAVELYRQMRSSSVKPDGHVFVAALQACARGTDLKSGQEVHADVVASGVQPDLFVCSCLVDMYAKCGSLDDARRVFDGLDTKDVVTWNSMMAGYTQQGKGQEALRLFRSMREERTAAPDSVTFVCLLQACADLGCPALEMGKQLHVQIRERGHQGDLLVANTLVNMYAKCGSLKDARRVFDGLGRKDVVTWNAMMGGYSQQGMAQQALRLYSAMLDDSMSVPDSVTFVCLLQACAKCGRMDDAQGLFDGLVRKDIMIWNAMIRGYSQQGMGQEALRLHSAMEAEGMAVPDSVTFVCLLQACAVVGRPALEKGRQLHAQIREGGHGADAFVASSLVNMYTKCGSVEDAQRVFVGLGQKDVVTWNAMIAGYSQLGMGQDALRLYSAMQEERKAVPDSVTFVCVLQACASVGSPALEMGRQLHAHIRGGGHQADVFVASSLVNMYAKCGSLADAQRVFDGLGKKDVVTWTAMIAGYSQEGMGQEALQLYGTMQEEGMAAPDSMTFVCLLQACASVGVPALEMGKQLHAQIQEGGYEADAFVVSSLVNMYAKCGSVEGAREVFDGPGQRDVVTWTAMIAGYSQQGMGEEALSLYSAMLAEGLAVPDSMTFVCLLQACSSVGTPALEKGKQMEAQIIEQGHQADAFVASSLVNMYAKCGSLKDAQRVFDGLVQKEGVTWTALIAGYSQQGMGQESLGLYRAMQEEGIAVPNSVTFACLLQACAIVGTQGLEMGKQLHAQIRAQGHQADGFVATSLVNMYAKCGSLEDAQRVFHTLGQKDVVTWNALIAGYSQQGMGQEALHLYRAMQEEGMVTPDSVTFVCLLQACAVVGTPALEMGKHLHGQIRERRHEADVYVTSSLVNMYAKCGSLEDARTVFDSLGEKNVVVWNAIIAGYSQESRGQEALHLYIAMQDEGMAVPDSVTFVSLLQACASMASLHLGRQLHAQIEEQGLQEDAFVAGSLINMYGKCGSMIDAQRVFDVLSKRDIGAWSALIAGYSSQGDSERVFDLVQRMKDNGIQPDAITSLSILTVCSHVTLVKKGQEFFEAMSRNYGITPDVEHYACMVDLFGRAGRLDEALTVIRAMPVLPSAAVWHTLLGACQKWNNVEVGRYAFDQAVKLDERDAAAYVLMSNVYTGAHMWDQAKKMQVRRKRIRAWKQPGQTWWTDMDGLVHSFLVGDLEEISLKSKKKGNVSHLDSSDGRRENVQLCGHTEKLSFAYTINNTSKGAPISTALYVRGSVYCQMATKFASSKMQVGYMCPGKEHVRVMTSLEHFKWRSWPCTNYIPSFPG